MSSGAVPAVSVIMPVYNAEKYLREAVDSILKQTFRDFELIIIDDESTDSSPGILAEYAARDKRIRVLRNEHRLGEGASRNVGIFAARAPLLAQQDADDMAVPERLEKQKRYLDEHPEVSMVAGVPIMINEEGEFIAQKRIAETGAVLKELLKRRCPMSHCTGMYRTEVLRKIGGYRPGFILAVDYDMLTRFVEGHEIGVLPEPLYLYRVVPTGDSIGFRDLQRQSADLVRQFAAERAATGKDSYEEYLKAGRIPGRPPRVPGGEMKRYYYVVPKIAVGEGEYRRAFRYMARGLRSFPALLPKYVYLAAASAIRIVLGWVGLRAWFERRFLAK